MSGRYRSADAKGTLGFQLKTPDVNVRLKAGDNVLRKGCRMCDFPSSIQYKCG